MRSQNRNNLISKLLKLPVLFRLKQATPTFFLYGTLFCIGVTFFILHFCFWVIPNWDSQHDFEQIACKVVDKRVAELQIDHAIVYRPEIRIEYSFLDGSYDIWTYNQAMPDREQLAGYISDKKAVQKIIDDWPIGEHVACWVKKDNPEFAILSHPSQIWGWFFLLMMFLIAGSGFVGLWLTIAKKRFSREHLVDQKSGGLPFFGANRKPKRFPTIPDPADINDSPGTRLAFRLPISQISAIRVIGSIVLCVFWNLIAWAVLFSVFLADSDSPPSIMSRIFAVLFFLVGLGMIVWVINLAMIAFGVGATLLELSDHPIVPGRNYLLHLMQLGAFRMTDYKVAIVCEEVARFRQGTDTITTRKEVFRKELFHKTDFETARDAPLVEEMHFALPYGAMHSLITEHNEIRWMIIVNAKIAAWPDLKRECPIIVRPSHIIATPYLAEYDDYDLYPR